MNLMSYRLNTREYSFLALTALGSPDQASVFNGESRNCQVSVT